MKFFKLFFSTPYLITKGLAFFGIIIILSGLLVSAFDPHLNQISSRIAYIFFYPYIFAMLGASAFYISVGSLIGIDSYSMKHSFLMSCSGSWISFCFANLLGVVIMILIILAVTFFLEIIYYKLIKRNESQNNQIR